MWLMEEPIIRLNVIINQKCWMFYITDVFTQMSPALRKPTNLSDESY